MQTYDLIGLTPYFGTGATQETNELRAPSIRGQVRWWFRALGGDFATEHAIFGGIKAQSASGPLAEHASRVVFRVEVVDQPASRPVPALPHKRGGDANPRPAWPAGWQAKLHVLRRYRPLDPTEAPAFQRALEAWLLLGSIGLRSTRGGGAFHCPQLSPQSVDHLYQLAAPLLQGSRIALFVDSEPGSPEDLRHVITNTIGGPQGRGLAHLRNPLGGVGRELAQDFRQRKTSPLRLTVRRIRDQYHIIALWDGRETVTGNNWRHLTDAIKELADSDKELGQFLPTDRKYWLNA